MSLTLFVETVERNPEGVCGEALVYVPCRTSKSPARIYAHMADRPFVPYDFLPRLLQREPAEHYEDTRCCAGFEGTA
jgi:hypothetical protein